MTTIRRFLSVLFALAMACLASLLGRDVFFSDGIQWMDFLRIGLLALSTAWLAWGAALSLNGFLSFRPVPAKTERPPLPSSPMAVLIPVYNEDPAKSLSHVAAMIASVVRLGAQEKIHFAILSDTNKEDVAREEEYWFARLRHEAGRDVSLYYRRRQTNPGKKAGNIADFIRTAGGRYEYLIILDADSLVEGATMLELARRMDAEPRLGLLQTLPKVVHARSLFGRAIQFSASFYSPVFARGVAELQGAEGPFWGHNAIVRTRAFAQSCGLPELPGRPPFGGHILSHDYVEAALLSRNDWTVRVDPDIEGSFEEGPDNVVDFAKRDRRWCQGNLQHSRVMVAPGLKPWSRFVFLQGIMAYVASPIWALFLVTSILAPVVAGNPDYFPTPGEPVFPRIEEAQALALLTSVFGLLIGPKFLVFLRGLLTGGNRAFDGNLRTFLGSVIEILLSSVMAPLMLLYQSRSVMQVLLGADSGWPAADREAGAVTLGESWAASWWIVATGCLTLGAAYQFAPDLVFWVAFVAIPAILAPFLIRYTSIASAGTALAGAGLLRTPQETLPSTVVTEQEAILLRWRAEEKEAEAATSVPIAGERQLAAAGGR